MSDISKINTNGTEYDLKDAAARAGIESSKTIKSSVVTVTDAAPINAEDITVDITPIQDLHGYDRPWAGGAGKNKLNIPSSVVTTSINGITYTVTRNEGGAVTEIDADGTATADATIDFSASDIPLGNVILTGCPSGGGNDTWQIIRWNAGWGDTTRDNGSGVTYNNTTASNWLRLRVKSGVTVSHLKFYPMIRLSTEQDPTFAPYTNICPIEGWTGAVLDRVGKNRFDKSTILEDYRIGSAGNPVAQTGTWMSDYISVEDLWGKSIVANVDSTIAFYNKDKSFIERTSLYTVGKAVPQNAYFLRTQNTDAELNAYQLELGTQPTTYEPYQGQQYTASFGETVYGGKWHVTEGGTDKTHANIASYNGESINEPWLSSMDEYSPGATPTTGTQVVYPLTAPTTISTPKQNVPMLQGINTVYANCGDVSLKYQPDNVIGELKGEIEDNIIYEDYKWTTESSKTYSAGTPGTYATSSYRDVSKEGYDVIGVTFVENRRFGDCILTLYYIPSTNHVEVIIFRATSSSVTVYDEDIEYRVAYKKV